MDFEDKAKNKIDEFGGKVKEAIGKATGDESTENEGKSDQVKPPARMGIDLSRPKPQPDVNPRGSDPNNLDQMLDAPEIAGVAGVEGKFGGHRGGGDQQVHCPRTAGLTAG